MQYSIGFSPCPNDTFIFDALVHGKVDTEGLRFEYVLEDVETLNQMAGEEKLDITKLSFGAYLHLARPYALLHAGSALGMGVGPLLISKAPIDINSIQEQSIAIPGAGTTANLLLSLALPQAKHKKEMLFSHIEQAVLSGECDLGLIIHENRFTYQDKGLVKIIDLGDWWEKEMHAAIPLGGIVMKRSFGKERIEQVDRLIRKSIAYAWDHYPQLAPFVYEHAQEMNEDVMRKHINLYVNEYSTELGATGRASVATLFDKALETGMIGAAEKINPFI